MDRRFVIVSGLPGSGKTTLGRRLAHALHLPLFDKDDFLERLFDLQGTGDRDWRRRLSRESDLMLRSAATASAGAVLVSFWRQPGMVPDSGTPTDWLCDLSPLIVNVHCSCTTELAARRFHQRTRHAGHLDSTATLSEVLADFQRLEQLEPIQAGPRVQVDTSVEPEIARVLADIETAFARGMTPACGQPIATRDTWTLHPCPAERASLNLVEVYSPLEFEQIKAGLIPADMDDKWFMFFQTPWLYIHRSWTGFCVFAVRFETSPQGAAIVESWVSRKAEQYGGSNVEEEERLLAFLIDALLLKKPRAGDERLR